MRSQTTIENMLETRRDELREYSVPYCMPIPRQAALTIEVDLLNEVLSGRKPILSYGQKVIG